MVTLISIFTIRIIRLNSIHFVKCRIFTLISIHFVKFRMFTMISIRFINFPMNTSISIHITIKLKNLLLRNLWLLCANYHIRNYYVRKLFIWRFPYNSLKPRNTEMHIGMQNSPSWEQNIHFPLYKTYLHKLDKLIFRERRLKALFSANHWAAFCRIRNKCCPLIGWENNFDLFCWGSEFWSYEIELRNQVTQIDVTLRVTNSKIFIEIFLSSY